MTCLHAWAAGKCIHCGVELPIVVALRAEVAELRAELDGMTDRLNISTVVLNQAAAKLSECVDAYHERNAARDVLLLFDKYTPIDAVPKLVWDKLKALGTFIGSPGALAVCPRCEGTGKAVRDPQYDAGMACSVCNGTGKTS
jgi:hypothetical protein